MSALDVLPLDDAKRYLNIPAATTANDEELSERFIPAAVARVGKHLGRSLLDDPEIDPLELMAVEVVLAEYWKTQQVSVAPRGYTQQPWEADNGPGGSASLRARLTDLLGEPAATKPGDGTAPQGSFPPPSPWPDPAERGRCW